MNAIIADRLTKIYPGGKKALDNVSFELGQGEVFGFLGPNGAGKTTSVKLLNGMISPSEGSCHIFGINPSSNPEKVHAISGVVTEHAQMYGNLTGQDNLVFYGTLFGISKEESRKRALELLERLDLTDAKDKKLSTYSTGMRQRLSLARAMIHTPKILFLDEPTSGLDPESAQSVNNMIKELASDKGTTVFLCTHQLRYAQEVCTSYGLIDDGTLLEVGSLDALRCKFFSGLNVQIKANYFPKGMPFSKTEGQWAEINVQTEEEIPPIIKHIVDAGGNVYSVSANKLSLEEIYFSLIEKRKEKKEVK
ncbi:ABC transporter ATP-binding protein [Clostridium intestinale]|uniref:ABC-2 type transport system ATP-binding protein n=1 Tax=Clostridium intestinale DSM 6191 TaxID=1121320 RepID=A0A1M5T6G6_9CLOT|nr:ABC transporter ATP-binding protein [Clostridium intestinale]SHH46302.1 ABC-2 type transport system ATP-binding protein [Clostridium intestinale DSM 6191]